VNVALIILHADPSRGGAEQYTADLAGALAARGHVVSLLAQDFGPAIPGVKLIPLIASGATRRAKYVRFLQSLETHLASTAYDIVHAMLPVRTCDVYHPHAGLAAEAIASGHRKHEGAAARAAAKLANRANLRRRAFAAVEKKLLAQVRPPVVLCLSEYVKATVRRHYSLPAEKLATLFNAVDLKKFDPSSRPEARDSTRARLGIGEDQTAALMIAQDFVRKGLREAILALSAVKDPKLVLVVVGRGNVSPYRKLARDHGVANRVIFNGPTDDPYSFYRAADFFVLPTRHDPCSLVVLESLAMGLPVISTIFNGACEIMEGGREGFVLPNPADVDALAKAMQTLLNLQRRSEMAKACLKLRPRLSFETHVDDLLAIYNATVRGRAASSPSAKPQSRPLEES